MDRTADPVIQNSTESTTTCNGCLSTIVSWYTSCFPQNVNQYLGETNHTHMNDKYLKHTEEISISPTNNDAINLEMVYMNCTHENTPAYGYENVKKLVKVLKVIDGDTLDIALYHDEARKIFKHRIRLYGIDTPEKRPLLSNPERNREMEAAKKAQGALVQRLKENDNVVIALFHTFDKYGRLMATFYDKQGDDINKWMITSGYAQEYFGKTKKKFVEPTPLMVSECDLEYFDTPRTNETAAKEENDAEIKDEEFEEFPEEITQEATILD